MIWKTVRFFRGFAGHFGHLLKLQLSKGQKRLKQRSVLDDTATNSRHTKKRGSGVLIPEIHKISQISSTLQ